MNDIFQKGPRMALSTRFGNLTFSALLLGLLPSALSAQGMGLQVSAGFGARDQNWDGEPWRTVEGSPSHLTFVGELGATYALGADHKARVLISGVTGDLTNQQVSLDYQYSVFRGNGRDAYCFIGPSLNNVSGTYRFHAGFAPPAGEGDYRYVDQRWRPGLKVGAGFQWTKHWAVELDAHAIHMATSGFQSVPRATTWYAAILMSYRLPIQ